jgi:hypothetical protein
MFPPGTLLTQPNAAQCPQPAKADGDPWRLTDFGVPVATARRANAASVQSIRNLVQRSARTLYLADDGKHVRSMVVRVGHAPQQPCAPRGLVMARNG